MAGNIVVSVQGEVKASERQENTSNRERNRIRKYRQSQAIRDNNEQDRTMISHHTMGKGV